MKTKLDKIFSLYIRTRDRGICISCGRKLDISECHCGHFFSRSILSLRFNEINCNCQCPTCNTFKCGNIKEYEKALKRKYGDDIIDKLRTIKNKHLQLKDSDYKELIEVYKQKLKNI